MNPIGRYASRETLAAHSNYLVVRRPSAILPVAAIASRVVTNVSAPTRGDEVGPNVVEVVDLVTGDELVDIDGPGRLDSDGLKVLVTVSMYWPFETWYPLYHRCRPHFRSLRPLSSRRRRPRPISAIIGKRAELFGLVELAAEIEALRSQIAGVEGAQRPRLPIHRYSRIDDVVRNRAVMTGRRNRRVEPCPSAA